MENMIQGERNILCKDIYSILLSNHTVRRLTLWPWNLGSNLTMVGESKKLLLDNIDPRWRIQRAVKKYLTMGRYFAIGRYRMMAWLKFCEWNWLGQIFRGSSIFVLAGGNKSSVNGQIDDLLSWLAIYAMMMSRFSTHTQQPGHSWRCSSLKYSQ